MEPTKAPEEHSRARSPTKYVSEQLQGARWLFSNKVWWMDHRGKRWYGVELNIRTGQVVANNHRCFQNFRYLHGMWVKPGNFVILWQPELGNSGLQKSVRSKDMSQTFKRFGDYDRQHKRPRIKPKIKKKLWKKFYMLERLKTEVLG